MGSNITERLYIWIAWHLPRDLVRWCFIRVSTEASTGYGSSQCMSEITCFEASYRWDSL